MSGESGINAEKSSILWFASVLWEVICVEMAVRLAGGATFFGLQATLSGVPMVP